MDATELRRLLAEKNPKLARYALERWTDICPNDPEPLLTALRSTDAGTLRRALKLACTHHPKACAAAIVELLNHPDHVVRRETVLRLDPAMGPVAAEAIRRIFATDSHPHVIATAVVAVGRFKLDAELIKPFLTHTDDRVRANAIRGLVFIAPPDLRQLIEPRLQDASMRVQNEAIKALAPLVREEELEKLILRRISSADANVRASTADLIASLPLSRKIAHLSGMLADPEPRVITVAARSLARLADAIGLRAMAERFLTATADDIADALIEPLSSASLEKLVSLAERHLPVITAPEPIVRRLLGLAARTSEWELFLPWVLGAVGRHESGLRLSALELMLAHAAYFAPHLDDLVGRGERFGPPRERALIAHLRWRTGRMDGLATLKTMLFDHASAESREAAAKALRTESGILPRRVLADAYQAGIREAMPETPQVAPRTPPIDIKLPE
ncbi:MAG TPA: HEAT repeat domain-containing protein [Candidatus Ozemobacteraceae bacterium]|nr:HEAT repeat domain-containing protein [Candidatus Ozemobacteraceae bacterium]